MKRALLHPWKVNPQEAIRIQEELRKKICLQPPQGGWQKIAAGDVSYSRADETIYAAFLLFSYPELILLQKASVRGRSSFPYIPGLLSFREAPHLLQAFSQLESQPDLLLMDGQGIAHPRSMGIAAHIGILLDLPTIGCAKSCLIGRHEEPAQRKGSATRLMVEGRLIGMVVRTREKVKPVFVSPGHRMNIQTSVKMILSLCRGYRIPESLRQAHIFANQLREAG